MCDKQDEGICTTGPGMRWWPAKIYMSRLSGGERWARTLNKTSTWYPVRSLSEHVENDAGDLQRDSCRAMRNDRIMQHEELTRQDFQAELGLQHPSRGKRKLVDMTINACPNATKAHVRYSPEWVMRAWWMVSEIKTASTLKWVTQSTWLQVNIYTRDLTCHGSAGYPK